MSATGDEECGLANTGNGVRHTRGARRAGEFATPAAIALVAFLAAWSPAAAKSPAPAASGSPRELPATVVWSRGNRAYLAAQDSTVLEPGLRLVFRDRKKLVATGTLEQVVSARLGIARLESGSLERVHRLDRVRVTATRPAVRSLPRLSLGYPAGTRLNPLFACPAPDFSASLAARGYRLDRNGDALIGIRIDAATGAVPWPDTLVVRTYGEVADQEIALERGEIDVAVFWPGELSAHLRAGPLGISTLYGPRSRGVLIGMGDASLDAGDPVLRSLDSELLGGDLVRWEAADPDSGKAPPAARVNWTADRSLPGAAAIERFLRRDPPAAGARAARLAWIDAPLPASDSLRAAWRQAPATPLYTSRCAVVCAPAVLASVEALGAGAFANLATCPPGGGP
jgi:hypothetical protein